jgi:ABC-type transporter Mla subunit MlaD
MSGVQKEERLNDLKKNIEQFREAESYLNKYAETVENVGATIKDINNDNRITKDEKLDEIRALRLKMIPYKKQASKYKNYINTTEEQFKKDLTELEDIRTNNFNETVDKHKTSLTYEDKLRYTDLDKRPIYNLKDMKGGNKTRKSNRRKSNKRKSNRRKSNKRKSNRRKSNRR